MSIRRETSSDINISDKEDQTFLDYFDTLFHHHFRRKSAKIFQKSLIFLVRYSLRYSLDIVL